MSRTRRTRALALATVLALIVVAVVIPAPVARSEPGVVKDMLFLLHSVNATETARSLPGGGSTLTYFDTTLDFNDANVSILVQGTQKVLSWHLSPELAGDFTAEAFTLRIWGNSSTGASSSAQVSLEVRELDAASSTLVHQLNLGNVPFAVTPELKTWSAVFATPRTFRAGSSIEVRMIANPGALQGIWFHFDTPQFNSRVAFRGPDSLAIAEIATFDSIRNARTTFDPTAGNQTMYLQARVVDPLGGYDVRWVNATIRDPLGTILLDNASMAKVSGTPISLSSIYELDWNYSGRPTGVYTVGIWAVDNNGHNLYFFFSQFTYGDFDTYREGTFSIGEQFYVNVLVRDDAQAPLAGSEVRASQMGTTIASGVTGALGLVNLTLGSGTYTFAAMWQSVPVAALVYAVTANVSASSPLVLDAAVFSPTLRVVDSRGLPLEGAAVTYTHPNGTTTLLPLLTDAAGEVQLVRTAGGAYQLSVRWRGTEVANTVWIIASSETLVLSVSVFHVDFHVVDSRSVGLAFASVVVRDDTNGLVLDFQTTNATGWASSRLPAAIVDVSVYTRDTLVADVQDLAVTGDAVVTISADVYYVSFAVTDSRSAPLEFAQIVLIDAEGFTVGVVTTDAQGQGTIRLPAGTYALTVTWKGAEVYSTAAFGVAGDASVTLVGSVFYIDFRASDSRLIPVAGATIVARGVAGATVDSASTNETGEAQLRLPGSTYEISVTWKGFNVFAESQFRVSSDAQVNLPLAVFYRTIALVDSRGIALENATVRVLAVSGDTLAAGQTDSLGELEMRLPSGTLTMQATWKDVLVASESLIVAGDGRSRIDAAVFYLTVKVVDRDNRPLPNVIVVVQPAANETGALVAYTDANGNSEFRLPRGAYAVTARLIATYLLSPIDLTERDVANIISQDVLVTITMTEFQPSLFSTNAFLLSLLFVLVVGALVAFIYFRYHRSREPKDGEEGEAENTGPGREEGQG